MLLDSPADLLPDSGFLLSYDHQSKGELSGLYCTAEGHSGILLRGGSGVTVRGNVVEGRNADAPCHGALLRVEGGTWLIRDNVLNYAMADPAATGRDDGGVVHVASGTVLIDGVVHDRASAVSEETPLVHVAAGRVRVRNVMASFRPVVRQGSAGARRCGRHREGGDGLARPDVSPRLPLEPSGDAEVKGGAIRRGAAPRPPCCVPRAVSVRVKGSRDRRALPQRLSPRRSR